METVPYDANLDVYPRSGTHADRILTFIKKHEGTTKNSIIEALELNPSVVRDVMRILVRKGLVMDLPDSEGRHHYAANR